MMRQEGVPWDLLGSLPHPPSLSGRVGIEAMVSRNAKPGAAVVGVVDSAVLCRAGLRRRCALPQRGDCENSSPGAANAAWWRATANGFTVAIGPLFLFLGALGRQSMRRRRMSPPWRAEIPAQDPADRAQVRRRRRVNDAGRTCGRG
jgi:hypothetical protein